MLRRANNRQLSTTLAGALTLALTPMGLLAIVLASRSYSASSGGAAALSPGEAFGIALPMLIWLTAIGAGWFAITKLVVEPLRAIESGMAIYGRSSDPARTQLRFGNRKFGSTELSSLATSFDIMADEIDANSRNLRAALAEQRRLTREVHHRVKNNLQIVSSLLSLQSRGVDSPEAVQSLAVIQARIAALMHVHRWMYDDATSSGVDLTALGGELCAGLEASLVSPAHPRVSVNCETPPIVLHPDTAVPVAFLITELTNMAADRTPPGPLDVRVTAAIEDGATCIKVMSPAFIGADPIASTNMTPTSRIIHGMARQLRSSLIHDPQAGNYSVRFAAP